MSYRAQWLASLVCILACLASIGCSCDDASESASDQDAGVADAGSDVVSVDAGDAGDGAVSMCAPLTCQPDVAQEPAASGDYRSWSYSPGVSVVALALSENGRRVVVGDQAGKVHLFEHDGAGTPLWTFTAPDSQAQFNSVGISRDGLSIVATDGLTSVHLFTCDSGTPTWSFDSNQPTDPFNAVAISHDGCRIAAVTNTRAYLFSRDSATPLVVHEPNITQGAWLTSVAIAGDGSRFAAGTWISDASGAEMFVFDHTGQLGSYASPYATQSSNAVTMPIAMSADGTRLAAGGADKKIHFFDGSLTPAWSHDLGNTVGSVWSLALSDDGSRLFASAGEDTALMFTDTSSSSPAWSYDGNYGSPHSTTIGLHDPYKNETSPQGNYGIGAYSGTVALSADGKYSAAGAWNSGNLFGMYADKGRPFRVYRSSSPTDPINVVGISADGSWIAAATTFGEVLAWEVAPAVMIEIGVPVTVNIPSNPSAGSILSLEDVKFERTLVKPGRAANMTETWSLWALIAGVPVPPELSWLVSPGDFEETHARTLADGNFDETTSESMKVPQMYQSNVTSVTGFLLRVELEDQGTSVLTSDEAAPFIDIQVGGGG